MNQKDTLKLISVASTARQNAFATRSEHHIGAAVLTENGGIFAGCNIESNISGLGICAERCAINNAIVHGQYNILTLLTYDQFQIIPCGACLQYLNEFAGITNSDPTIIAAAAEGGAIVYLLSELLPKAHKTQKGIFKIKSEIVCNACGDAYKLEDRHVCFFL